MVPFNLNFIIANFAFLIFQTATKMRSSFLTLRIELAVAFLLLLCFFASLSHAAQQRTLLIDPTSTLSADSGDCNINAPCKTIAYALLQAQYEQVADEILLQLQPSTNSIFYVAANQRLNIIAAAANNTASRSKQITIAPLIIESSSTSPTPPILTTLTIGCNTSLTIEGPSVSLTFANLTLAYCNCSSSTSSSSSRSVGPPSIFAPTLPFSLIHATNGSKLTFSRVVFERNTHLVVYATNSAQLTLTNSQVINNVAYANQIAVYVITSSSGYQTLLYHYHVTKAALFNARLAKVSITDSLFKGNTMNFTCSPQDIDDTYLNETISTATVLHCHQCTGVLVDRVTIEDNRNFVETCDNHFRSAGALYFSNSSLVEIRNSVMSRNVMNVTLMPTITYSYNVSVIQNISTVVIIADGSKVTISNTLFEGNSASVKSNVTATHLVGSVYVLDSMLYIGDSQFNGNQVYGYVVSQYDGPSILFDPSVQACIKASDSALIVERSYKLC